MWQSQIGNFMRMGAIMEERRRHILGPDLILLLFRIPEAFERLSDPRFETKGGGAFPGIKSGSFLPLPLNRSC